MICRVEKYIYKDIIIVQKMLITLKITIIHLDEII